MLTLAHSTFTPDISNSSMHMQPRHVYLRKFIVEFMFHRGGSFRVTPLEVSKIGAVGFQVDCKCLNTPIFDNIKILINSDPKLYLNLQLAPYRFAYHSHC